jgi:hypothetical protein
VTDFAAAWAEYRKADDICRNWVALIPPPRELASGRGQCAIRTPLRWFSGTQPSAVSIIIPPAPIGRRRPSLSLEKSGATLRYLPKYSPDLNPIELPYSKFKTFLRKVAARAIPALTRAIRSFIPQLSPQECANYFTHAGYASI